MDERMDGWMDGEMDKGVNGWMHEGTGEVTSKLPNYERTNDQTNE